MEKELLKLDDLLESIPQGVIYQGRDGEILKSNRKAREILGIKGSKATAAEFHAVIGTTIQESGKPLCKEDWPNHQALYGKQAVHDMVVGIRAEDPAELRWLEVNSEPIFNSESSEVAYILSSFQVVDERVCSRKELHFREKISNFLLGAVHDLKVKNLSELGPTLKRQLEYLAEIIGASSGFIKWFESSDPLLGSLWQWQWQWQKTNETLALDKLMELIKWLQPQFRRRDHLQLRADHTTLPPEVLLLFRALSMTQIVVFPIGFKEQGKLQGLLVLNLKDERQINPGEKKALNFYVDILGSFFQRRFSSWNLRERVKELACIGMVFEKCAQVDKSATNVLSELVIDLPDGFLFPERTYVEILFDKKRFYSGKALAQPGDKFKVALQCQRTEGAYLMVTLERGLSFLKEEFDLIERVAKIIESEMQRRSFTDQLQSTDARFSSIVKSDNIYFLRLDPKGRVLYSSARFQKDFSWLFTDGGGIIGQKAIECIAHDSRSDFQNMFKASQEREVEIISGELEHPAEDGGLVHCISEFKAVQGANNEVEEVIWTFIDISLVKRAQRVAERFKKASDQSVNASIMTDLDGHILYYNKQFEELSGLKGRNLLGLRDEALFDKSFRSLQLALRARVKKEGSLNNDQVRITFASGKSVEVILNAAFINDPIEPYVYYSALDITERNAQEQKLKEQNQRMEAILKSIPDRIFINNRSGDYLEYMPGFNAEGADYKYLIGQNIEDSDNAKNAKEIKKLIAEVLDKQVIRSFQYHGFGSHADKWFESIISPIDDNRVLRLMRDISMQKEYEEQMRRFNIAVHQSPVGVVIADLDGMIEYASPSNLKISGYLPRELVGKSTKIFGSGKTARETYRSMWSTLNAGEYWEGDLINRNKAGSEYWEHLSITPMKDDDGKIIRYMALKQNVNAEKRYKENLRRQNEIFRKISLTQAHDVRGPIARIMGLLDLLKSEDLSDAERQIYLDGLELNAEELDMITRKVVQMTSKAEVLGELREIES